MKNAHVYFRYAGSWTSGGLEPNLLSNLICLSHVVFDIDGHFIPPATVFLSRREDITRRAAPSVMTNSR